MDIVNINFESGWKIIREEAIEKIEKYLENEHIEKNKNLFSATEYTRLYTVVYNMCAKKNPFCYSKEVYRKYGESLSMYTIDKIKPLLKNSDELNKTKILIDAWFKYSFYTKWMNKFLRYLDRYYVEYNSSLCLSAYTKNIFKITLFNELREDIKNIIYEIYNNLRLQEEIDQKELFCNIVELYKELDNESNEKMYEHDIEKKIVENVNNFYKKKAEEWINDYPFDDYIISIENAIEKEYEKNKSLNLNDDTCEKVTNIIVKILIYEKLNTLIDNKNNIFHLLKNNNLSSLRRTYILFSYFPEALTGLKKIIGEYIKMEGNELKDKYVQLSRKMHMSKNVNNMQNVDDNTMEDNDNYIDISNDDNNNNDNSNNNNIMNTEQNDDIILCDYIEQLIKLHNHYDNIFKLSFFNISNKNIDPNFNECLKDYFESFVEHEDEYFSTVKLLVIYTDNILKRDLNNENSVDEKQKIHMNKEEKNDEQTKFLMKKMSEIVEIFNYTSNKETFFEYYRVYLANRLINNIYISLHIEKKFIEQLYYLCGSQYTSKLGGMIQDLINNTNMNNKFYDHMKNVFNNNEIVNNNNNSIYNDHFSNYHNVKDFFSVKILNKGYWPTLEKIHIQLNEPFNKYIQVFEEYYKSENKNRKLEWIYELSEVILHYEFNNILYNLYCNVVNAQILLLFNKYKYINYDIVKNELQIDLKSFTDHMYTSFYHFKLITSNDQIPDWTNSNFYINNNFSYPNKNVYIKKTTALLSKEHEKTKEDRTMAIEAAIVRVMKMHKKLFYDQIFDYVKKSLSSFSPTNQVIEKKIDLLVEREYIQKEENSQIYVYIP
ncbi:hypothetical protein PFHG_02564 [Plasmodium falciparum HB3]|uniref:Cullin family profile domain-containing protein n=1 Tax=Plasmodium falciparum (isolate HB3) TaxID=137071 RepID=A0A0L7KCE2_PLAFX|nr:hypothetical protein PFHG_02564 [Plasmodium falciparum HB3]